MSSPHPLQAIADLIEENNNAEVYDAQETLGKIEKLVNDEFAWWVQPDNGPLWNYGYALRRLHDHPIAFPHVNPERVFAEIWADENDPSIGVNNGEGILQHLLSEHAPTHPLALPSEDPEWGWRRWELVTKRDWIVSAAVIRWLGSNVGRSFIDKCEREIERIRSAHRLADRARQDLQRREIRHGDKPNPDDG